jgi:hypothetical protein|tara:strand:- start:264 stop:500 length:237 start_codon:yes stop_codon:yes gene_type:complete
MKNKEKRYVVTMDMYVYAENDYMAKKRANDLKLSIENRRHSDQIKISEIGEQPFASLNYRKLDSTEFIKKESNEPLPF